MASSTPVLLGPPEIYQHRAAASAALAATYTYADAVKSNIPTTCGNPFMDLMVANYNNTGIYKPPMGLTQNYSPTFLSSGNPCLDFFFHVVPDTPSVSLRNRLRLAWNHDPLKALKLVCHLRGVRGTGKSDMEGFYTAALWLHQYHPKTLASNVASFAEFGYFKDLLEILFRLLEGADARKLEKKAWERRKSEISTLQTTLQMKKLKKERRKSAKGRKEKLSEYPEYEGVEDAHYAYRVRDRLRKEVLVPLRKVLELPEVYIGANDWGSIPYNRVASVAMKHYKEKFLDHDGERFREYLEKVRSGEAKIAAGALLPHEIIAALDDISSNDGGAVAELQWKRMVDDMAKKGTLNNCLAICDVSGSMSGIPMEVSVALGVLVSELSEEPWKGRLITFSASPKLQMVEGDSLREKTMFVRRMEWGMNTNFQKVFDLILEVAMNGKLKADDMIKRYGGGAGSLETWRRRLVTDLDAGGATDAAAAGARDRRLDGAGVSCTPETR
ncbi:hypothetical protein ACS0TY_024599 [Phlomoides rotata]